MPSDLIIIDTRETRSNGVGDAIRSLPMHEILHCVANVAGVWLTAKQMETQAQVTQANIWSNTMKYLGDQNHQNIQIIETNRLYQTILEPMAKVEAERLAKRQTGQDDQSIWNKILQVLGFAQARTRERQS